MRPYLRVTTGLLAVACLGGCASVHNPDPIEPFNRKIFAFNDAIDDAVLKPASHAYNRAIPQAARTSIGNFFANPMDLWSSLNLLLQGRPAAALSDAARFGMNTTIGFFGLFDVASSAGLRPHREGSGQTLARWGVGTGAYLVLPLLGPSTVRDSTNVPAGFAFGPSLLGASTRATNALTAVSTVHTRAAMLPMTDLVESIALDRYVFMREGYLQRQRALSLDEDSETKATSGEAAPPAPSSAAAALR